MSKPMQFRRLGGSAMLAKGRMRSGEMNGTEKRYAAVLDARLLAGEIAWYVFESITLKLADDTRYTPDFAVMLSDGSFEFHEVKGFALEDSVVKWKVAGERFPFVFRMIWVRKKADGGGWLVRTYGERDREICG